MTVAVIGEEGEDVPQAEETEVDETRRGRLTRAGADAEREEAPRLPLRAMSEQVTEVREQERNGRVKASPLARRIARERGIDLAQLRGTGPEGRIVAEDVERAEMAPAEAPGCTRRTSTPARSRSCR